MEFYALALKDCIDCFYDFELGVWGDGICESNLLPSVEVAGVLRNEYELFDAEIVEVELKFNQDELTVSYEDIWER